MVVAAEGDGRPPRWVDYIPIDEIRFAKVNPKLHDVEGIARSIDEHGVGELPLLDERTGRLVAGHGRIEAQRAKRDAGEDPPDGVVVRDDGVWCAGVTRGWRSRSDAQASSYLVGSNELTSRGGWDDAALAPFLRDIEAVDPALLAATGFSDVDVAAIEAAFASTEQDLAQLAKSGGTSGELWPRIAGFKAPPVVTEAWKQIVDSHDGHEWMALADLLGVTVEPDGHVYDPNLPEPPEDDES